MPSVLPDQKNASLGAVFTSLKAFVKKDEIKDEVFEVPAFYKIVTRTEMEKLFEDIQK